MTIADTSARPPAAASPTATSSPTAPAANAGARASTIPTAHRAASEVPPAAPADLVAWVDEIVALTRPARIHWVDGSRAENDALLRQMVTGGQLIKLNPEWRPGSYLARSHPSDVARTEARTFIASEREADAGPTNNWVAPTEIRATLAPLFDGAMRGRTMYVVPFSMGPVGGPLSHVGVQITDSAYAVASLSIMTRVGTAVLEQIAAGGTWIKTVHSVGAPLAPGEADAAWPCNDEKYIVHFPDTLEVYSYGSGYGGNAILAKKCVALRIASVIGRDEGWLAEHMLLIRLIPPEGRALHLAAAFPSACGKTNLAMLQPTIPGWRVETLGDDIVWLRPGPDGRLWAINPEAGFFGIAPGTGEATNATAVQTLWGNTIFTNVALRPDGDVWWEGLTATPPPDLVDWRGQPWTPDSGTPAAHPNSRFAVSAAQCPQLCADWDAPEGVPLDAMVFGGRRADTVPLVAEATDWSHGVFLGTTIASERTAAADGVVGERRRDPFAMLPFCGYHMADYFAHWLAIGRALRPGRAPRIFQVNWFRKGPDGRYLWPGFGENARVLEWIARRIDGGAGAVASPVGTLPRPEDLNLDGLEISHADLAELFAIDPRRWLAEAEDIERFYASFGPRLPAALRAELAALRYRLARAPELADTEPEAARSEAAQPAGTAAAGPWPAQTRS